MTILTAETTNRIYKYKIRKNQWIPIVVIELPYTYSQIHDQDEIKDVDGSGISFDGMGLGNLQLPYWVYSPKNYVQYDHTFLETFEDDHFHFYTSINVYKAIKVAFHVTTKSGTIAFSGDNLDNNNDSDIVGYSLIPYVAKTADDRYLYLGYGGTGTKLFFKTLVKITGNIIEPAENESKGFFNTSQSEIVPNVVQIFKCNATQETAIKEILKDSKPVDLNDPNDNGGSSKGGGGGGADDIGGDTNSDDGLPTVSALDSGLLTAYNPTEAQLQSLGRFLWSDSFDVTAFKKLFNDPFDTLFGLSIIPIKPATMGAKSIMFGNLDSGVVASVVSSQWVTKDMGSVSLNEVWKGALDYSPSTSASIYLPFIGMRQLNINDVMGSTLHLIYKFDVLTGGCIAQIYVNHNHLGNKDGGFSWNPDQGLLYEFMGQCAVNIPLASQDFTNTIRSAVSAVGMVAGASASIATGNPVLGVATATMASANLGMQANTPTVERSGHLSGSCSLLGYYQPFLVVTRPHQCKPSRYYALRGIPSQVYTSKLSNCTGFTQITANNNIHVSGASDAELAEIQNLLVSGVYFPSRKR